MSQHLAVSLSCRFDVGSWSEQLLQQTEGAGELKRASIVNALSGSLEGQGWLEYQLLYPADEGGEVSFIGYERVVARWGERQGSLVLRHDGVYSAAAGVSGSLRVMPGSGSGDFAGLSGDGRIVARAGEHGGEYLLTLQYRD
ncbi:DUF3224 domain-containing protein [Chromobacterium subtsugae]|uniref:DUF3224 domain-containing protein n=1 Tax=Chromobacterium subtsugae TaxID=251747 RepID=A0ABS7F8F9_9NEIS|nr:MULTISPECIES: DUF3224 domain-containing protein [Chromobacterium]KUM03747.1 hypothetical protein Cv017_18195 [Chromobacterium subtsugae]KZE86646.1 hypothetical protein AWB61_00795 [Chromobacterium sp. F49]MBW7565093.1 DUF3224 domain-containing protein [Chromobacterium subtsugae]MBW8286379.1 DUF3224 domain-containing protein [Chromobacterium subtsugae]WSE91577.1 DUF3224 domain-containing protein [Chromobacterium subtsugae]